MIRRRRLLACLVAGALGLPWVAWQVSVRGWDFPREALEPRAATSVTVLDAQGQVLRQIATAAGGRESWVALEKISPHLVAATLASEDRRFWSHGGVDPLGIGRAVYLDLRHLRAAYGGSTVTMQLVRSLAAPAAERPVRGYLNNNHLQPRRRTLYGKLREMILAARLERTASKGEILEQYLNRIYYGNGAWGAEAAAQLYFGKPAAALSAGEGAFLAVLPRGPEAYNPYRRLPAALARRAHILTLMERQALIDPEARRVAEKAPLGLRRERPDLRAGHFVDHALGTLPDAARGGGTVWTTLDGPLQERLEVAVRQHLVSVGGRGIGEAGVVVLRNSDGAILGMVGSHDYLDAERHGAVNATLARRRPASTLKPYVYALAIERGDTPASIALDVILPRETHESYTSDVRQHGFARYRESLAGSYNLSAVHTLEKVGVETLLDRLRRSGISTLDRAGGDAAYGLNLAIGEAEVRLIELAASFSVFGNGGLGVRPFGVARVDAPGVPTFVPPRAAMPRVFSPEIAYLVYDILSDTDARRPMFGVRVPLVLQFPVALKTGTTRAYTDNFALGTTGDFTVGVWAGNFDGTPTRKSMAMEGATPLLRAAFVALAARFGAPAPPPRPPGLVAGLVCALSGMAPHADCPTQKRDLFLEDGVPHTACTWHVRPCGPDGAREVRYPPEIEGWARTQGLARPPGCPDAPGPLRIVFPANGARFVLDAFRPPEHQVPPLRAIPAGAPVSWSIDGIAATRWRPTPGDHVVRAELGASREEITVHFD